jgi:hypothetical protein
MAGAAKKSGSGRKGARALDYVETQQEAGAKTGGRRASAKAKSAVKAAASVSPKDDSPKRQGDKLPSARGKGAAVSPRQRTDAAGDPSHDSPKRQGDKLENAARAAAGRTKSK